MKISIDRLPKRIIISRKGSDSEWGGSPSLIVDDKLISLPIPEHIEKKNQHPVACNKHLKYVDLPRHNLLGDYLSYLPKLNKQSCVHLDPDIRRDLRTSDTHACKYLFGQNGAAEAHLRNQRVSQGDLFLFFGWFREFARAGDKFVPLGPDQHIIWGWFEVESRLLLENSEQRQQADWAKHHPHVRHWETIMKNSRTKKNSLYVAPDCLRLDEQFAGAGIFEKSNSGCLTQMCGARTTRSQWCIPRFLADTGLTYHKVSGDQVCNVSKTKIHISAAGRGQEFVFPRDTNKTLRDFPEDIQTQVAHWLLEVFSAVDTT